MSKSRSAVLTAHFDEGPVRYRITSGGYQLSDDRLRLAIESEIADDDDDDDESPEQILLAINNAPFQGDEQLIEVVPVTNKTTSNASANGSRAYLYAGFHAEQVAARIEVLSFQRGRMRIRFTVSTENLNDYTAGAPSNRITGECVLTKTTDSLWLPEPVDTGKKKKTKRAAPRQPKPTTRGTPILKKCKPTVVDQRSQFQDVKIYGENLDRGAKVEFFSTTPTTDIPPKITLVRYESAKRIDIYMNDKRGPRDFPWSIRVINNNGEQAVLENAFVMRRLG